jgi:tRNA modification GTPase
VAIVGPPNAGKSTLFNALVGSDRAIVTALPGTTRDAVSEEIEIGGERIRLVDTAGLRETEDEVERQGVAVARRVAASADLAVVVEDGCGGDAGAGFLVRTKADVRGLSPGLHEGVGVVTAPSGAGVGQVRAEIARRLRLEERGEGLLVLERHRSALLRAGAELVAGLEEGAAAGPELLAGGVRRALAALGEVTGETATEELLDRIFARFCLGK